MNFFQKLKHIIFMSEQPCRVFRKYPKGGGGATLFFGFQEPTDFKMSYLDEFLSKIKILQGGDETWPTPHSGRFSVPKNLPEITQVNMSNTLEICFLSESIFKITLSRLSNIEPRGKSPTTLKKTYKNDGRPWKEPTHLESISLFLSIGIDETCIKYVFKIWFS